MKKEYISPKMAVIEIKSVGSILESSYTNIGGTTTSFNARNRNSHGILSDIEEE